MAAPASSAHKTARPSRHLRATRPDRATTLRTRSLYGLVTGGLLLAGFFAFNRSDIEEQQAETFSSAADLRALLTAPAASPGTVYPMSPSFPSFPSLPPPK